MNIRRRSLTDSLQLLVDTICNLFGSIIIISLLMALLSQDPSTETSATERAATRRTQIQQAQSDLDEARRLQSALTTPSAEGAQRLALAAQIAELKTSAASNLANIQSNATRAATMTVAQSTPVEDLLTRKSALASDLGAITNQLDRLKQAHTRQLRLPRERATGKKTCYFIVRFGKIYPVQTLLDGRRERNTQTLDWRQTPDGETATPRRDLGIDAATSLPTFARLLNDIPAQTYSIHFLVYNDSFPTFLTARQIPLARNFDTGWEFLPEDRPIIFSPGGEAPPAL